MAPSLPNSCRLNNADHQSDEVRLSAHRSRRATATSSISRPPLTRDALEVVNIGSPMSNKHSFFNLTQPHLPSTSRPSKTRFCCFCNESLTFVSGPSGKPETGPSCLTCWNCGDSAHILCEIFKTKEASERTKSYPWVCEPCKLCHICGDSKDGEEYILCDYCDRLWHLSCLSRHASVPSQVQTDTGRWECPACIEIYSKKDKRKRVSFYQDMTPEPPLKRQRRDSSIPKVRAKCERNGERKDIQVHQGLLGKSQHNPAKESPSHTVLPKRKKQDDQGTPTPGSAKRVIRVKVPDFVRREQEEDNDKRPFAKIIGKEKVLSEEQADYACPIEPDDCTMFEQSLQTAKARSTSIERSTSTTVRLPLRTDRTIIQSHSSPDVSKRRESHFRSAHPSIMRTFSEPIIPPASHVPPGANGSTITHIRWGTYRIKTWHFAPYPKEYTTPTDETLYICEYCLSYLKNVSIWERHRYKCPKTRPPGTEIYSDDNVSVFEVDGQKNKIYCQNLCLLAKMFLDHKTLYYDVEPFLFYVMTNASPDGCEFVGYFSKEKRSPTNNVSCIMTLPTQQGEGWGQALIDFSYLLTKTEQRTGTPERPLTGLGLVSYRYYWTFALYRYFASLDCFEHITFEQISKGTGMMVDDIYWILQVHGMIENQDPDLIVPLTSGKASSTAVQKAQRRRELTIPRRYQINVDMNKVSTFLERREEKGRMNINPESLQWRPFLVSQYYPAEDQSESASPAPFLEENETIPEQSPDQLSRKKKRKQDNTNKLTRKTAPKGSKSPLCIQDELHLLKPTTIICSEGEEGEVGEQRAVSWRKPKRVFLSDDEVDNQPFEVVDDIHVDREARAESTSNSNGVSRATSNDEVSTMLVPTNLSSSPEQAGFSLPTSNGSHSESGIMVQCHSNIKRTNDNVII